MKFDFPRARVNERFHGKRQRLVALQMHDSNKGEPYYGVLFLRGISIPASLEPEDAEHACQPSLFYRLISR